MRLAREAGPHEKGSPVLGNERKKRYSHKKIVPVAIKMDCKRYDWLQEAISIAQTEYNGILELGQCHLGSQK